MSALRFDLRWATTNATGSGADATWGLLSVYLDGQPEWGRMVEGSLQPVRWTWIDLLESLAARWPWLLVEEGWPLGMRPEAPGHFDLERIRTLEACPEDARPAIETALFEFRERHDLSRGLHGISLPELWVVREGRSAWIGSRLKTARVAIEEVLGALEELGQRISDRLSALEDERAREAVALWANRSKASPDEIVSIGTGLDQDELKAIAGNEPLAVAFEIDEATLEPSELLAAARMSASVVEPETIRLLLKSIRVVPHRATPALDELAQSAREDRASWAAPRAYREGHQLAAWLRSRLGIAPDARFDPEAQLKRWKVQVRTLDLEEAGIDAVACWGGRHGPAVIINRSGKHAQQPAGLRATLAHEIAHLLADRFDALPFSEVLGGKAPLAVERRARAFAAELLLPRLIAGEAFAAGDDPKRTLRQLCQRYGVSREITAWQANNSGRPLDRQTRRVLRPYVSSPWRFSVAED